MSRKAKDREDVLMEITHKQIPRELEDFQAQRRQRYEHSYDMSVDIPTVPGPIEKHMQSILEDLFKNQSYEPETMRRLALKASNDIKNTILGYVSKRVRVVCQVLVGERLGQPVRAVSRCVWDPDCDRSMRAVFQNQQVFAAASAFALFYE